MRDEYVGDIGDFGKYILLRELSAVCNDSIKIGINWYYNTRPEGAFGYLSNSNSNRFQALDGPLFGQMKDIVSPCRRTVAEIERADVLPKVHHFYREAIPYSAASPAARQREREDWFSASSSTLADANIIFLDPDNGIETAKIRKTQTTAVKYAFFDEIEQYYAAGKSVIIYNHRNRESLDYFAKKCVQLKSKVGLKWDLIILKATKFQVRHYIFVPRTKEHENLFRELHAKLISQKRYLFESDPELDATITRLLA